MHDQIQRRVTLQQQLYSVLTEMNAPNPDAHQMAFGQQPTFAQ